MICLAMDTSGPLCQVALVAEGEKPFEVAKMLDLGTGHAEHLFQLIDDVLTEARIGKNQIDRIAVTTGPGSFTGLRVGIAAAKGLSLALDCTLVGVNTLELAFAGAPRFEGTSVVALDARRDQYYVQQFEVKGDQITPSEPQIVDYTQIHSIVTSHTRLITNHSEVNAALKPQIDIHSVIEAQLDGLVLARHAMGLEPDGAGAEPLYVRAADAKRQTNFAVARQ